MAKESGIDIWYLSNLGKKDKLQHMGRSIYIDKNDTYD